MDFVALKAELAARGFDSLTATRQGQFINWARAELDEMYLWPYREESATGTAPLTITDLGTIEAVIVTTDSNRELMPNTYQNLVAEYGDLSVDGTPMFYYVANPSGSLQVATYPESSETIGVQYWEVPPDLTGSDSPLAPARFHSLYVDIACRMAYVSKGNSEAVQAATVLQAQIDRGVARMVDALLTQQVQGPEFQQIRAGSADW